MSRIIFLVFVVYAHRVLSQETCDYATTYLQDVLSISQSSATSMTFTNPNTASNKCRLESTCCTSSAESSLISNVETIYQNRLFSKLNSTITPCLDAPLQSIANEFIMSSKANTIQAMKLTSQAYFTFDETLFNSFYSYLTNGITNMDLSNLQTEFQTMYFKVFVLAYTEGVKRQFSMEFETNDNLRTCLYGIFTDLHSNTMTTSYERMKTRFNLYLRHLWAVKTGDEVLRTVRSHSLSSDCKEAILRMAHCSHCSVHAPSSACSSFCTNTLRGCLVDLTEFGDAYSSYVNTLKASSDKLKQYDPFGTVNLLASELGSIVSATIISLTALKSQVDSQCSPTYTSRKRRSVSIDLLPHLISKRQSTEAALNAISDSATCSTAISELLNRLPEDLCDDDSDVSGKDYSCWNGTDVDSYWWVVAGAGRLDQLGNPELNIQANTGLLYKTAVAKLKTVSSDLNQCQGSPRNCDVKLSGLTNPTGLEFNFGDSAQFQAFTETGFPDPVIVSVIPVAPTVSTSTMTSSSEASLSHTFSTSPLPHSQAHTTSSASQISLTDTPPILPSSSSNGPVRPPVTASEPAISTSTSLTKRPTPTSIDSIEDHIPDPDKAKTPSSSPVLSASFTILSFLLLTILILFY